MDATLAMDNYVQAFLPKYVSEKLMDDPIKFFGRLAGIGIFELKTTPHPLAEKHGEGYTIVSKAALDAYNSKALKFGQLSEDHVIGRQYSGEYLIKNGKLHPRATCTAFVLSKENFAHASSPDPKHAVAAMGTEMYVVKRPAPGRRPKGFVLQPVAKVKTAAVYSLTC
jgi:hypothetical protein